MVTWGNNQIYTIPKRNKEPTILMRICNIRQILQAIRNKTNTTLFYPCQYHGTIVENDKNAISIYKFQPTKGNPNVKITPINKKMNLKLGSIRTGKDGRQWMLKQSKKGSKWVQIPTKGKRSKRMTSIFKGSAWTRK